MIRLSVAGVSVELDHEVQFSLVLSSPFPLMDQQEGGNFVFDIRIHASPELKKALGFPHRPAVRPKQWQPPFELFLHGLFLCGKALLKEADADSFQLSLPVMNGQLNADAKLMRLPQLNLGGNVYLTHPAAIGRPATNLEFEQTLPHPFELQINLPFANNNDDAFLPEGVGFIVKASASLLLKFDFNTQIACNECRLHLLKDQVEVGNYAVFSGRSRIYVAVEAAQGNQLSWYLSVTSYNLNDVSVIQGTIANDSMLTIAHQGTLPSFLQAAQLRYPQVSFAAFPIENPNAFELWPDDFFALDNRGIKELYSEFFKVINYFKNNVFPLVISTNRYDEEFVASNLFVPFPYIAFLVQRIADTFGYTIENNVFEQELQYAVLINFYLENEFRFNSPEELIMREAFRLNEHVPDWTIYEFLQQLCTTFALGYEVDAAQRSIRFVFVKELLSTQKVQDITHLCVSRPAFSLTNEISGVKLVAEYPAQDALSKEIRPTDGLQFKGYVQLLSDLPVSAAVNDCYYVAFLNAFVSWNYDPDLYVFGWVFHSRNFSPHVELGSQGKEVVSQLPAVISLTKLDAITDPALQRVWNIPASHQPASFHGAPDIYRTDWKPMICWYHGMRNDSLGQPYPYGSADITDPDGNEIPGMICSLSLGGPRGLYQVLWASYLNWRLNSPSYVVHILPDTNFMRSFRFSEKVCIQGVHYLVASMKGTISSHGYEIFELLLLPV